MIRFLAILEDPGRVWSDYAVIDTMRRVRMCRCSHERDAETIAGVLNIQHREREAGLLVESTEGGAK